MLNRRSFKTDESFLEKISIGAIGTRQVFDNLRQQGHMPIELERGSMSYKIWKSIKIKRLRVPDILLLNSNRRVESRAKTKLEISMSHSFSNHERSWDSGLANEDYVALVGVHRSGVNPIDWEPDQLVQYISVGEMRKVFSSDAIVKEKPKGREEGFEERITWLSSIARAEGVISQITPNTIQYQLQANGHKRTLQLKKKKIHLIPQVNVGDFVRENQILASVVPVVQSIPIENTTTARMYVQQLHSSSQSERYTAAKALFYFQGSEAEVALADKIKDEKDHIYVRMDSAASLARQGNPLGYAFIENCLIEPFVENQLEAVIVLSEIASKKSIELLLRVLKDPEKHAEVRAGAAWGLGEIRDRTALYSLVQTFNEVTPILRIEAARALAKIAEVHLSETIDLLPSSTEAERPGIAWALSKAANFSLDQLLGTLQNDDTRRWVSYILGCQQPQVYIEQIETLREKDPEVYFAVTVLWQIMNSWVYNLEMYG